MRTKFIYEKINGVHLELTTKCNANCPMCNRNYKGKIREKLPILELSLNDIKKIMPKEFVKQLKLISLCGVYGEPICNKEILPIIAYFYECNPSIDIDLYTNGSLHDITWWRDLALLMKDHKGTVIFGIDGIGDVHSLHRCGTNFETIIRNARTYIKNGGNAQWDFIVFKHNEHQVYEAEKMSKSLGFSAFQIKKTSRFFKNLYENSDGLDSNILEYGKHPVYDLDGNIKYYIELPTNMEFRNKSEEILFSIIKEYGTLNNYFNKNIIECDSIKNGGIFISASGEVFPCCTVYQQICYKTIHEVKDPIELNEYKLYSKYNLSAFNKSIKEIVEGNFFSELLESFKCNSLEEGKPKSCSRTCGKSLELHKNGHTTRIKYRGE